MDSKIIVLGFYKYVRIENVEKLKLGLQSTCKKLNLKGSILLAKEGINASISGSPSEISKIKSHLLTIPQFKDLFFKEEETFEHPFKKMKVKVKEEIVAFNHPINHKNAGKHISPQELSNLYQNGKLKENVIILDARNDYEYRIGKFKSAIHLNLNVFREFQNNLQELKKHKNKKVVMYCTGGVRCEKASAYLKSEGFNDVSQLNQGIIQFGKQSQSDIWEGKCFVFDKRMFSPMNSKGETISQCLICNSNSDLQRNCKNVNCNLFYVSCLNCEDKLHGCCSEGCKMIFRKQREKRQ